MRTEGLVPEFGDNNFSALGRHGHFLVLSTTMGRCRGLEISWLAAVGVFDCLLRDLFRRNEQRALHHHGRNVPFAIPSSARSH